jgi:hypothetical protein
MDSSVRKVSIAESARIAAQLAADTLEHQENPHFPGSQDHLEWAAAYRRHFDAITSPEGEASA